MSDIPFNVPELAGRELEYVAGSMAGGHTSSGGPFSKRAGALLQEATGAEEVLLTTSCTAALELSAMLLDLGPDDTVIVPSFTFTSSALAFARQGAKILFCDIEPETLGIDPEHLASLLDDSVRAVVVVHYAGHDRIYRNSQFFGRGRVELKPSAVRTTQSRAPTGLGLGLLTCGLFCRKLPASSRQF